MLSNSTSVRCNNYTQVALIVVQLPVLAIFKAQYLVLFAGFMTTQLYTKEAVFLCDAAAADP